MTGARWATVPLRHDGIDRPCTVVTPATANAGGLPLLVELHGRGIDPIAFDRWTGLAARASERGWVVALPAAIREIWNDGRFPRLIANGPDDVGYLDAVIAAFVANLGVDPTRVSVVGMSNGATMAGRLALQRPDTYAGVVQVAGTAGMAIVDAAAATSGPPLLQIHGTADRFNPYAGGRASGFLVRLLMARRGGAVPSIGVDAWAERWIAAKALPPAPSLERVGPDVAIRHWRRPGTDRDDLVFVRVEGGGHTWPGNRTWTPRFFGRTTFSVDATQLALDFLDGRRRTAQSKPPLT